jgi:hypothetical protein
VRGLPAVHRRDTQATIVIGTLITTVAAAGFLFAVLWWAVNRGGDDE